MGRLLTGSSPPTRRLLTYHQSHPPPKLPISSPATQSLDPEASRTTKNTQPKRCKWRWRVLRGSCCPESTLD
jgi:hypothetical protein